MGIYFAFDASPQTAFDLPLYSLDLTWSSPNAYVIRDNVIHQNGPPGSLLVFPTSLVLSQTSQPVTVTLPPTSHRSPNHPYTPNAIYLLLFRISRSTATTIACQSNIHPPLVLYITPGKFSDARSVLGSIIVFFDLREAMHYPIQTMRSLF